MRLYLASQQALIDIFGISAASTRPRLRQHRITRALAPRPRFYHHRPRRLDFGRHRHGHAAASHFSANTMHAQLDDYHVTAFKIRGYRTRLLCRQRCALARRHRRARRRHCRISFLSRFILKRHIRDILLFSSLVHFDFNIFHDVHAGESMAPRHTRFDYFAMGVPRRRYFRFTFAMLLGRLAQGDGSKCRAMAGRA